MECGGLPPTHQSWMPAARGKPRASKAVASHRTPYAATAVKMMPIVWNVVSCCGRQNHLHQKHKETAMSTVLVTGGSGFIGSHSILQLLAAGHQVRTTVRSLKRESDVRALLRQGGAEPGERLRFAAADLES